jgi:hypothetical protein
MMRARRKSQFEVPRTILGRFVFACLCLFLMPVAGTMLYISLTDMPIPQQAPFWSKVGFVLFAVVIEFLFLGLFIFAFFGLIWSVSKADWAARMLQIGFRKMWLGVVGLLLFFCSVATLFALFM